MRYAFLFLLLLQLVSSGANAQADGSAATPVITRKKIMLRNIIIEGNHVTRRTVILREMSIHEGDSLLTDSLQVLIDKNRLRLFNLQIFNEVDQHTEVTVDGLNWYVRLRERWYIQPTITLQFADRNFNTWWVLQNRDLRRAILGLTLTHKNFRGNLENLSVTAQAGYTQKLAINYVRPYINHKQTNGLTFSLSMAQSHQVYYKTDSNKLLFAGDYNGPVIIRQFEGGIGYIHRPAYASRHIVQLNYKNYGVSDTVLRLNPAYYEGGSRKASFIELFYRYEYNGVDNWNYSLRGFKLVAQGAMRHGLQGLTSQSYVNVEAGFFRPLAPRWYYDVIFRGRLQALPGQPYFFRGGLGTQTDYVRGYEYYIIDGTSYGLVRLDLKRELFNRTYKLGVKYFTAIPIRLYPKIFFDAGYIHTPPSFVGNSFLSNRVLYSAGIGLDVVTLYDIKIRFEFAYNHLLQNGLYLHFNSE